MDKKKCFKCKIDEVIINSSNSYQKPALINFEEGTLPEENAGQFSCSLVENSEDESNNEDSDAPNKKTMVLTGDDNEKYVGKILPYETSMCRTMIMIRNKESNKIKLIEVDKYNVMKVIKKVDHSDEDDDSEGSENLYETNRERLYKMFGSKRSLRNLDLSKKTKVNVEVMRTQMEKTAGKINVVAEDLEVSDGSIEMYLPKCNRSASRAEDVYRLEDMLTPEELESLDEVTEKVLSDPPEESPEGSEFSQFFVSALKYVGAKKNATQIKCLIYADAILYFLKLKFKDLTKKKMYTTVCPFSTIISEKIFEQFTVETKSGRIRPEQMTDKAVCWIVILTVIACKFSLDNALVCPYLLNKRLDIRRFEKILKVVGLSSLNAGFWILKTPLVQLAKRREILLPKLKKSRK